MNVVSGEKTTILFPQKRSISGLGLMAGPTFLPCCTHSERVNWVFRSKSGLTSRRHFSHFSREVFGSKRIKKNTKSFPYYYLRSRQVIERWELLLLLLLLLLEDYFEVMTLGWPKVKVNLESWSLSPVLPHLPLTFLRGGIRHSLIKFLFGVGSIIHDRISLRGGICSSLVRIIFGVGSLTSGLNNWVFSWIPLYLWDFYCISPL